MIYTNPNRTEVTVNRIEMRNGGYSIENATIGDYSYMITDENKTPEQLSGLTEGLYLVPDGDDDKMLLIFERNSYGGGLGTVLIHKTDGSPQIIDMTDRECMGVVLDTAFYIRRSGEHKGRILIDGFSVHVKAIQLP